MISVCDHPLLDVLVFETRFPKPLSDFETPPQILEWLSSELRGEHLPPISTDDKVKRCVRDLLRHAGFKPTGRNKPASEYLLKAAAENRIGSINIAVDILNAVSLHSGLPISVVDRERLVGDSRIDVASIGQSFVFNASGQSIDVGNLLCWVDAQGPCANAVKDSQRTKTSDDTQNTISVIWGSRELPGRTEKTFAWYQDSLVHCGATVHPLFATDQP